MYIDIVIVIFVEPSSFLCLAGQNVAGTPAKFIVSWELYSKGTF
jgi:hypothetical protein